MSPFRNALTLFTLFLALCSCAHRQPLLRKPDSISYDKTPGFSANKDLPVLEWSTANQKSMISEPQVPSTLKPPKGLRLKWLGTAGFELSDDEATILIDPFISRPFFHDVVWVKKLQIDEPSVDEYLLNDIKLPKVKAILTSHGHHDHVMDIPYILAQYPRSHERPLVVGTSDISHLLEAYSEPSEDFPWLKHVEDLRKSPVKIINANEEWTDTPQANGSFGIPIGQFGNFKVTAFITDHGTYDDYPFFRLTNPVSGKAPMTIIQYGAHMHITLAYLIEYKERFRIFVSDSPTLENGDKILSEVGHVDLLLKGIASRKFGGKVLETITALKPRYFVPTHYDNLFKPISELNELDYAVRIPFDQIKFKEFLDEFQEYTATKQSPDTKLRLMRMLYYYSLNNLVSDSNSKSVEPLVHPPN